jgi:hypothetical protein
VLTCAISADGKQVWTNKEPENKKDNLISVKSLRYLIDAICHVTEPLGEENDGSDN